MDDKKLYDPSYVGSPLGRLERSLYIAVTLLMDAKSDALAIGDGVNLERLDDAEGAIKDVISSLWENHGETLSEIRDRRIARSQTVKTTIQDPMIGPRPKE